MVFNDFITMFVNGQYGWQTFGLVIVAGNAIYLFGSLLNEIEQCSNSR